MNYIIFDLEATCDNQQPRFHNEIIEIGAVKLNQNLEIIDTFQSFVKPVVNPILTDFCKQLTTIQQEDVDSAFEFPIVVKEFQEWIDLNQPYKLISWGLYDKNQLRSDSILHSLKYDWVTNHHISLKHLHAKLVLKNLPFGHPLRKREKGIGMERALHLAGLPLLGTHHRGIDDARNITQIFQHYFHVFKDHIG